jgi:hypothetical protein
MANYRVSTNTNNRTRTTQDKTNKKIAKQRQMNQQRLLKLKQTIIIIIHLIKNQSYHHEEKSEICTFTVVMPLCGERGYICYCKSPKIGMVRLG